MCTNGSSIWLRRIALLILFSATSSAAWAQTTQPASTITAATVDVSGDRVLNVADDTIQRFAASELMTVTQRQSDSLLNGALIGAGIGFGAGLFVCRAMEPWDVCFNRDNVGSLLAFGAIGAGIGLGVDALIRQNVTTFAAPGSTPLRVVPLVGRRGGGVRVGFSF